MQTAQLLEQLYSGKTLNKEESAVIFNAIMQGELNNEQIAAMLIALKVRGATIEELSGAVSASLQPLWVPKWQNTVTVVYRANPVPVMY